MVVWLEANRGGRGCLCFPESVSERHALRPRAWPGQSVPWSEWSLEKLAGAGATAVHRDHSLGEYMLTKTVRRDSLSMGDGQVWWAKMPKRITMDQLDLSLYRQFRFVARTLHPFFEKIASLTVWSYVNN